MLCARDGKLTNAIASDKANCNILAMTVGFLFAKVIIICKMMGCCMVKTIVFNDKTNTFAGT
jgi:hypothetical protein